jgi:hypothetical protein
MEEQQGLGQDILAMRSAGSVDVLQHWEGRIYVRRQWGEGNGMSLPSRRETVLLLSRG